jgi:hypothetical protein
MLLESSPLNSAEAPRETVSTTSDATFSRRISAAKKSSYARVRDEVEVETRKDRLAKPEAAGAAKKSSLWQNGAFGFGDLIDVINPLQHIPIVSTFYRNLTGDQLGMAPRVIGGALWGRIGGFVAGIVNSVVEWFTGKDIGDHIYTAIFRKSDGNPVAQATQPESRSAARRKNAAQSEVQPVSDRTKSNGESERLSLLTPEVLLAQRIQNSLYHRDEEHKETNSPAVHLRA